MSEKPVGAGAGPAEANVENLASDMKVLVKKYLKKIRAIPYDNTVAAIKNAVQELIDDEELENFMREYYDDFKASMEGIFANQDMSEQKFKQEVKFYAGKLENQMITKAINLQLGLGIGELYGRGPRGGKRRNTRKSKKSRKHRKTSRRQK